MGEDSSAEAVRKVLSHGAAAEDGVTERHAERTNWPTTVQTLNEAGITDPIHSAGAFELAAVTWYLVRTFLFADNPPDSLLVFQRDEHRLAPSLRAASTYVKHSPKT